MTGFHHTLNGKQVSIHLIKKLDAFKSNWFEWYCEVRDSKGNALEAYIQGDYAGNMISLETLEIIEN